MIYCIYKRYTTFKWEKSPMTQLLIRIEDSTKRKLASLARGEGRSASVVVRGLINSYIQEHDPSVYIDDLWQRIGAGLASRGTTQRDIAGAIRAVRKRTA
jgi:predicted DNA-binding protein